MLLRVLILLNLNFHEMDIPQVARIATTTEALEEMDVDDTLDEVSSQSSQQATIGYSNTWINPNAYQANNSQHRLAQVYYNPNNSQSGILGPRPSSAPQAMLITTALVHYPQVFTVGILTLQCGTLIRVLHTM